MCAEADEQKCSKSFWGIFRCDQSCSSAWCTEIDRQVDSYRQAGRQTERQSERPIGKADRQTDMRCEIKAERERGTFCNINLCSVYVFHANKAPWNLYLKRGCVSLLLVKYCYESVLVGLVPASALCSVSHYHTIIDTLTHGFEVSCCSNHWTLMLVPVVKYNRSQVMWGRIHYPAYYMATCQTIFFFQ